MRQCFVFFCLLSCLALLSRAMFSGIVEEIGTVDKLVVNNNLILWDGSTGSGVELTVQCSSSVQEAYVGCSIAVNGVCLTAIQYDQQKFTVGLAPETLRRSNLGSLVVGSKVNLERALRADGRNSGHFVQGHVDGTGEILDKYMEGDSLWMKIGVHNDLIPYIVPKGFICVDGTSLTICEVLNAVSETGGAKGDRSWFTLMLVAHTQQKVIFPSKEIGDKVNIEVDVLAKMVERSLAGSVQQISEIARREERLRERVDAQQLQIDRLSADLAELRQKIKNL